MTPWWLAALTLTWSGHIAARTETPSPAAEVVRTVYFSALDASGAVVTDLTAADLSVKEGGKDRAIAAVQPATAPMQVAILIDDAGIGAFQSAAAQFLQVAQRHGVFAISVLNPQPAKLVNYTADGEALKTALGQLGQRGRVQPDGEQIIDAVSDAAKELQRLKAPRPVILVLTTNGETLQSTMADAALSALKASGASLNVLYAAGLNLGRVLGDGPRQSGGFVTSTSGGTTSGAALAKLADTLAHQYVLTYTLPDGVKMNEKLQLTTTRKGVTLTAPNRIPDK